MSYQVKIPMNTNIVVTRMQAGELNNQNWNVFETTIGAANRGGSFDTARGTMSVSWRIADLAKFAEENGISLDAIFGQRTHNNNGKWFPHVEVYEDWEIEDRKNRFGYDE